MAVQPYFWFIFLLPLCAGGLAWDTKVRDGSNDSVRDLPCPDPAAILPCVCSVQSESLMTMDCSDVTSEEELAAVFSADMPFSDFFRLYIDNNGHLKTLKNGALGTATFEEIVITDGVLQIVEHGALSGSYSTTTYIRIYNNDLWSFPFEDLHYFTILEELNVGHNRISSFPPLSSSSLKEIYMYYNLIEWSVSASAFSAIPLLEVIDLDHCRLTDILPGTFSGLQFLRSVDISYNQISHLQQGIVNLYDSPYSSVVDVRHNYISIVDINSISGIWNDLIHMENNQLEEVEESVWRQLLEHNNELHIYGNPLTCGCDIAWIILNPTFLSLVSFNDPKCATGESLTELNPAIYVEMC